MGVKTNMFLTVNHREEKGYLTGKSPSNQAEPPGSEPANVTLNNDLGYEY